MLLLACIFFIFMFQVSSLPKRGLKSFMGIRGGSQLSASPKLKLVYFDAKGAAELSRVILKVAGIDFEDFRYSIKVKEGGGFETPEFTIAKTDGSLATNMDRAPLLIVDGTPIGQSRAIERYVAKIGNMMGSSDVEAAQIDCIVENVKDIKEKWGKIRMTGGMGSNPEKEAAMQKWFDSELGEWLLKLERSLPSDCTLGFAVGKKISYADLAIWNLLRDTFTERAEAAAIAASHCEKLVRVAETVGKLSSLDNWLKERPKSMF